jgi:hypothetical protein
MKMLRFVDSMILGKVVEEVDSKVKHWNMITKAIN